jgi:hypothetical protein
MAQRKIHFGMSDHVSICRKFVYSLETAAKMTKAEQLKYGFTQVESETTCQWCIEKILLRRYLRGEIKL